MKGHKGRKEQKELSHHQVIENKNKEEASNKIMGLKCGDL
jgi:hypothetical protein